MPVLVLLDGVDAGREYELKSGTDAVIGRGEDADVQVMDKNASRHHARLTWYEGLPTVIDLGSANGTLVNGLPAPQIALLDGDELQLGETRLRYVETSVPQPKKGRGAGGLKVGNSSGQFRAVAPTDVTTQAFAAPTALQQNEALHDTYKKLKSLYRALQSFSSAGSTDELLRIAADTIMLAIPCDRVAVFLADETGRAVPALQTWREEIFENRRAEFDTVPGDLVDEITRVRQPLFFLGEGEDPDPADGPIGQRGSGNVRSSITIGAPVVEGSSIRGMLVADSPVSRRRLNKNDLDLVGTLAHQMAEPLVRLEQLERLRQTQSTVNETARDGLAIITRSPAMKPVLQMVRQVAPTDATVLVIGESGTGKELTARAIHNLSMRRDRPMVCVNCAALPEALIESELFGHEKGAFTGAFTRRPGKFEAADGGTIFLDEIGDLPQSAQSKLLRVLQEGEIQRVGSTSPITVSVRVVAATNVALEEAVKKGKFREDLYYRIRVVEIVMPPLRDRFQDIAILAQFYLETFRKKIPTAVKQIGPEAMQAMANYRWPGNVRELRNVIERAIVLATGPTITLQDLPAEISAHAALSARGDGPGDSSDENQLGPDEVPEAGAVGSLADVEKRHIRTVLDIVKGNKVKAAKILGISRTTLYEKIKTYGLEG